eukprot:gnl/TRDRNA2_/TRDRNA2_170395_c1_seq6.p1 gnl/TRDRNA2_/TRDRNA2_170395_c1~~gnl/TRDRNA2_/TRDRNA2_170395_c1_seq6.p1  ORF type:complete len:263 (+),score=47.70 gnl/TRDRNA2_/TRDRNA2_170395_c1_seq6:211-999(+)
MGGQSSSGVECCTPRRRDDDSEAAKKENVQIRQIGEMLEEAPQENKDSSSEETSINERQRGPYQVSDYVRWDSRQDMAIVDDVFHQAEGPPMYMIRLLWNNRSVQVREDEITKVPLRFQKREQGDSVKGLENMGGGESNCRPDNLQGEEKESGCAAEAGGQKEMQSNDVPEASAEKASQSDNSKQEDIEVGDIVEIRGLTSSKGHLLNGLYGKVACWDDASCKFSVIVDGRSVAIKPQNLCMIVKGEALLLKTQAAHDPDLT